MCEKSENLKVKIGKIGFEGIRSNKGEKKVKQEELLRKFEKEIVKTGRMCIMLCRFGFIYKLFSSYKSW
jgi:hypothetical protein